MAKKKPISSPSLFEQDVVPSPLERAEGEVATPKQEENPAPQTAKVPPLEGFREAVTLRDGEILKLHDEVFVDDGILTGLLKEAHGGKIFVIEKMTEWKNCESGVLVVAYQKDKPELKTTGIGGKGIDANWFKKTQA